MADWNLQIAWDWIGGVTQLTAPEIMQIEKAVPVVKAETIAEFGSEDAAARAASVAFDGWTDEAEETRARLTRAAFRAERKTLAEERTARPQQLVWLYAHTTPCLEGEWPE